MLGRGSRYAEACFAGDFVGAHLGIDEDLTGKLPDEFRSFNQAFIPVFLGKYPAKTKIGAGLACGQLWTVARKFVQGDILLCPDGAGTYRIAEVTGDYEYAGDDILRHRRKVRWIDQTINRTDMSDSLRGSTGSIGTVCNITKHREEIDRLIGGTAVPTIVATDETIEDPSAFAMEKHLEHFLVQNWEHTELGVEFDIFEEDGERVGQQFPTDTGPLDILAVSKDKKRLLVVELKKGRASDAVVGQLLRYMGFVKDELAEDDQEVVGMVIAQEDSPRLRRALSMLPNVDFRRYQISFKLIRG
jgi:restriction system protein